MISAKTTRSAELFQTCKQIVDRAVGSAETKDMQWLDELHRTLKKVKDSLLTLAMPVQSAEHLQEQVETGALSWNQVLGSQDLSADDRVQQLGLLFSCGLKWKAQSVKELILSLVSWDKPPDSARVLARRLLYLYLETEITEASERNSESGESFSENSARMRESLLSGLQGFALCGDGDQDLWRLLLEHMTTVCKSSSQQKQDETTVCKSSSQQKQDDLDELQARFIYKLITWSLTSGDSEVGATSASLTSLSKWLQKEPRNSLPLKLKLMLLLPDSEFDRDKALGSFG